MRAVTAKPPKILTEASTTAPSPSHFDTPPAAPSPEAAAAISAPTTITEEIALVTAISGVCSAGDGYEVHILWRLFKSSPDGGGGSPQG
ncbi:hypothetical protein E4T56_gene4482 [Termitomyces sp. T112]|nr:hypothetical protein E4T56_gene4482 [Termitomyces sp. T112]